MSNFNYVLWLTLLIYGSDQKPTEDRINQIVEMDTKW